MGKMKELGLEEQRFQAENKMEFIEISSDDVRSLTPKEIVEKVKARLKNGKENKN